MPLSLRTVLPVATSPITTLQNLPACAGPCCPRPATLWQRWWARHEGIWLHENWYCSPECFHSGLYRRLELASLPGPGAFITRNRLPLGLVLLSRGDITPEQLRVALAQQAESGSGRIGEWLVRNGLVSEQQIITALAEQQGCVVLRLHEPRWLTTKLQWPDLLSCRFHALPFVFSPAKSLLLVGFLDQVDRSFLLGVERMLRCRTEPCIVTPAMYRRQQELQTRERQANTVEIHQRQSSVEMMRTIGNYAAQVHAERCSMVRFEERLWIRLEPVRAEHLDLVFRLPTNNGIG